MHRGRIARKDVIRLRGWKDGRAREPSFLHRVDRKAERQEEPCPVSLIEHPTNRGMTPYGWVNMLFLGVIGLALSVAIRAEDRLCRRSLHRHGDRDASRSKPSPTASPILGGWRSSRMAGCSSPNGRGGCASSPTASCRSRCRACPKCSPRGRGDCSMWPSTPTSSRTASSICPMPSPGRAAPRRPLPAASSAIRGSRTSRSSSARSRRSVAAIISARVSPSPPTARCSSPSASASHSPRPRTSATTSARSSASILTGRCPRTIPSSAAKTPARRSGPTVIATPRARPSIPRPASCGRPSSVRSGAMSSIFRKPARITAGRW